jgi:4-hydroxybenzoate polyprenyltransferase
VGAWLAVTNGFGWAPCALGIAVGTWIGGFDLIYSCQDADIDRQIGSRSFPARFGIPAALTTSSVVHAVTLASFAWFGAAAGLGWLWWTGVVLTGIVLVYEHSIVRADDLSRVNRAFFTANGVIGIGLFGFALADLVVHGLTA